MVRKQRRVISNFGGIDRETNTSHGHSPLGTRFLENGTLYVHNSKYDAEQHYEAAALFAVFGSLPAVEKRTGIPSRTLSDWRHSEWFGEIVKVVNEEREEEIRANFSEIILKAQDEIKDRVANGDEVLTKDGELRRVKMKGKDAAVVASIAFDKNRISLGKPTRITDTGGLQEMLKKFEQIAEQNREKKVAEAVEGDFQILAEDGTATP